MLDLLICAAAAYYAAFVVTQTSGPFGLFDKLNKRLPHGGLLDCFYCLVLWAALLAFWLLQTPVAPIVQSAAGAGIAALAFRAIGE